MKVVVQRVTKAQVKVDNLCIGEIGAGFLVLLGIAEDDRELDIDYLVDKIINLRVFKDEEGKFNLSLIDIKGEILIVSQFTLYADTGKGRRPSFVKAARSEIAEPLYEKFVLKCQDQGISVAKGKFGAYMRVELENDGPVTIVIESKK